MAAFTLPPPLREGDRLTREEFMRRWERMPDLKRAELIDGIVHMSSPVGRVNGDHHLDLSGWAATYVAATPGCRAGLEGTWLMGERDVPQPDLALRILPEFGGQSRDEGIYSAGAPELIVEISSSSAKRDSGDKLRLYERTGVREYVTALVKQQRFVWRELVDGAYRPISVGIDGVLRSRMFPGLWLDTVAFWSRDLARLIATVKRCVQTEEHAAFVRELATRKR